ncbi:Cyclic di-GMP phosphodiesterase PdeB [Nymphon striatum]|nr:Cyclic di-GMP phosphodiesterase PdeB [Nymphon striatum]
MGLSHEGGGAAFKNTEAVLGVAAVGVLRNDAEGKSIYDIIKLQNTNDKGTLKKLLTTQFEANSKESDWIEIKLLNDSGELHLLKLKTSPIFEEGSETGIVKHLVLIMQDITSDRQAMQKLFDQASRDSLTGLINRHSFQNYMELVIAESEGNNTQNVLCYMDLDHFKTVNDVCGHAAGDELLRQISETIGALEFDSGYRIADIGHLMIAADEACYSAKKAGRNQLFVKDMERHEISVSDEDEEQDSWESTLKQAIERDEFLLYAQPINDLSSENKNEDSFYEILLRLKHDDEVLSPGSFMPTAERLGLMGSVDRWVVSKMIELVGEINKKDEIFKKDTYCINLSVDSVSDDEFTSFVELLIKEHNINPAQLCFEVSESDALANFSKVQSMFSSLIAIGCCGSLDDFGSGFSSLNYLRELPIKYLKVDGTFVGKMSDNTVDAAMVEAVNKVVQTMDIMTVAESVEDEETNTLLKEMGINYGQGYFYSQPVPVTDIGDFKEAA